MAVLQSILAFFFAAFSVLLMLVILLQRGRGVGLSGAFGGAGGTTGAFGSKTGDVLTWVTIVGFGVFVIFAIILNFVFVPTTTTLGGSPAPATPAPPASAPAGAWLMPGDALESSILHGAVWGEDRAT